MKRIWLLMLLIISQMSFAASSSTESINTKQDSPNIEKPQVSLGTCGDSTDYFIYKCIPFKCNLPIANYQGAYREMEVLGYQDNICLYNYKIIVRIPKGTAADFPMVCKLSEQGRIEMANMFSRYKKGDIAAYAGTEPNEIVTKECNMQNH